MTLFEAIYAGRIVAGDTPDKAYATARAAHRRLWVEPWKTIPKPNQLYRGEGEITRSWFYADSGIAAVFDGWQAIEIHAEDDWPDWAGEEPPPRAEATRATRAKREAERADCHAWLKARGFSVWNRLWRSAQWPIEFYFSGGHWNATIVTFSTYARSPHECATALATLCAARGYSTEADAISAMIGPTP